MNNSDDEQTGAKVRKLRDQASMSIDAAAHDCGVTSKEYIEGEAGVRRFSSQELLKLCRTFGVSLSDIFGAPPSQR